MKNDPNLIRKIKFRAIGTNWYFEFFEDVQIDLVSRAKDIIEEFEKKFSRFIDTSFVSQLNSDKYFNNPDDEFFELIKIGKDANKVTNGSFDISIGGILEDRGYDSNYSYIPKDNRNQVGNVSVTKGEIRISPNSRIDLGGLGKGYLVDKVKNFFLKNNIKYFLINAGGDIYATSDNKEK
ncbi:MAG: FAD:protein FMN transferase [Candidatus Dojkabacteria bacterium]|nr:FAD:protein FMN transferase [Candidatus Dojkabacteria bacterium]